MGISSVQTAIELYRMEELVSDFMPWQVHEGTGLGSECSPEHTGKMEAVGRLAGGIAHILNNQLTVIYACVDLFLPGISEDNPMHRALSRIRNSAMICANLTRQLLLFSCRLPLFKVPTDLNQRLEELMKILPRPRGARRRVLGAPWARLGGNIDIKLETSPYLWKVNADTAALDEAITNLVQNARDAMQDGGTLTIKTENVHTEPPGQAGVVPGRFVRLSVSDTGAGIDETNRSRIFEPFYTTKQSGKGIGLGLPVAYGIIRAHGGWIEVDSALSRGSTFRINLPAI